MFVGHLPCLCGWRWDFLPVFSKEVLHILLIWGFFPQTHKDCCEGLVTEQREGKGPPDELEEDGLNTAAVNSCWTFAYYTLSRGL